MVRAFYNGRLDTVFLFMLMPKVSLCVKCFFLSYFENFDIKILLLLSLTKTTVKVFPDCYVNLHNKIILFFRLRLALFFLFLLLIFFVITYYLLFESLWYSILITYIYVLITCTFKLLIIILTYCFEEGRFLIIFILKLIVFHFAIYDQL